MGIVQDIPKFYTALAEWISCLVFVLLLKRRWGKLVTFAIMLTSLAVLGILQEWIGIAPIELWIPGMAVALFIMYGTMLLCCKETAADIGFYWAIAFIFAEFAASLEWQFYSFYSQSLGDSVSGRAIFLSVFYGATFYVLYKLQKYA